MQKLPTYSHSSCFLYCHKETFISPLFVIGLVLLIIKGTCSGAKYTRPLLFTIKGFCRNCDVFLQMTEMTNDLRTDEKNTESLLEKASQPLQSLKKKPSNIMSHSK